MKIYQFRELSEASKDAAFTRYANEIIGHQFYLDDPCVDDDFNKIEDTFDMWTFNALGERIV